MSKVIGIVRKWIQWNTLNGDRVIWGSDDVLQFNRVLGVKDMEDLAMEIDASVVEIPNKEEFISWCLRHGITLYVAKSIYRKWFSKGEN